VIEFDGDEGTLFPTAFVASTSKLYEPPFVKPVTAAVVPEIVAVLGV
jgi:hypothetical protein